MSWERSKQQVRIKYIRNVSIYLNNISMHLKNKSTVAKSGKNWEYKEY